jgi:hypothetical protein
MKSLSVLVVALFLSTIGFGQSNKEDIDMIQAMFGKSKKELIQAYMVLPDAQTAGFWSMYDKYENERKALGRERINLIEGYANAYETMTDAKATDLMTKKNKWINKYTAMQSKYFTSMSAIIGGKQASKFMQLEDYIENNIRLEIQDAIPFIDELDKTKVKEAANQ